MNHKTFMMGSQEIGFSVMKTTKEYVDDSIRHLFNSMGQVGEDIHIEESARRIAHKLQGQKYPLLSQYKFDDLLLNVIQNTRTSCVSENDLCTYLMWYVEYRDIRKDIITVLRSRLQYLTGEIANKVRTELVFNDL